MPSEVEEARRIIQEWCEHHLNEGVSRWHPQRGEPSNAFLKAGDGIIAELRKAGLDIIRAD